jgi:RNA polymerase sigma-70 factor (ECF subfamily)
MTDEHSISELVERAQGGDSAAMAAIFDHFADPIFRFVRFRMGNPQDAEDVSQRVFLQMIEALPRYERRGKPFRAWLFRIARNAIIDHARTHHASEPLDAIRERASHDRGPEAHAMMSAEMEQVASALAYLPDDQREVIGLRFVAELSPTEIAAVLGRRAGTVRATQFRALAALRRRLEPAADTSATEIRE